MSPASATPCAVLQASPRGSLLVEALAALFLLGVIAMAVVLLLVQSIDQVELTARVSAVLPHLAEGLASAVPADTLPLPEGVRVVWVTDGHLEIHLPDGRVRAFAIPVSPFAEGDVR